MDKRQKDRRSILIKIISIILIIPPLFSSCLEEEADNRQLLPERTILFYMAGDNGLSEETQEKVDALVSAWNIADENRLLVFQDRGGENAPRLLEIKAGSNGKGMIELLEEYKDGNSATTKVFARVLNDMVRHCPSSDYGLVLFSHSSGWFPTGTFAQPRSVVTDGDTEFELIDFARTIPNGQFRFIIFESCLMAGAEVVYELKDKTDYIFASSAEILSPGFTPLYGKMLECLYKFTPDLTAFASEYYDYCNGLSGDNRSATVSVISTAGLTPLKSLLARAESHVEHWEWVERDGIQHFDRRAKDYLFYDLEGYIKSIGTQEEINELAGILEGTILYKAATDEFMPGAPYGFPIKQHCGLTIYIPVAKFKELNTQRNRLLLFSDNQ
ncbi:clostripain-related cysteine peptidase [Bacteroides ovatus]|jgi:hypothetical protein|uniref:clostripain-related cysteine peptidase n=1 Tax=Bacteroides ovatus TaxID=28116 RepID=UPI0020471A5F|nr:clostripain-related cysteine peptidase [Bacteroides ovatus]UYI64337.1 MAG: clostripain-related cysteine peptidase [Bacteroides ovatus]DAU81396.1 MAG TPA: Clostripain family protein [Caudoviricetes sp.]